MLTRTPEYSTYIYKFIPSARVLLDLGNVSVNRRIFINTHTHINTHANTHIHARKYTHTHTQAHTIIHTRIHTLINRLAYGINYVFFSRHDVSVVIIMMYTSRIDILFPSKLFMETKAIEWCFLILLRGLIFIFWHGSIACLKRAFG